MNPDFDNASHNETLNTSTEEESKLVRKAMARRKIEEYSEEKKLRQQVYDNLDNDTERLLRG